MTSPEEVGYTLTLHLFSVMKLQWDLVRFNLP